MADPAIAGVNGYMLDYMNWFMSLIAAEIKGRLLRGNCPAVWGDGKGIGIHGAMYLRTLRLEKESKPFRDALNGAYKLGKMHRESTGTPSDSDMYDFVYYPDEVIDLMKVIEEAKMAKMAGECTEKQEALLLFLEDKHSAM